MNDRPVPPAPLTPGFRHEGPPSQREMAAPETARLEALLAAEPLLDLPPALVARILRGLPAPARRLRAWAPVARFAAAAACFVVAWLSLVGAAPAMAEVLAPDAVSAVFAPAREVSPMPSAEELLARTPAAGEDATPALGVAALGVGLLLLGPLLARRWRRPPAGRSS